jgi:RNA polymerase sigma-70 factor (ECF subfamily)
LKEAEDELLMISVRRGVLEALTPLFERYHGKLYNFFLRQTFNRELSKDLTQSVFYRILKYRHSYREEYRFRSWMYQVARNVLSNHYGTEKMKTWDHFPDEWFEDQPGSHEEETEKAERRQALYRALSRLPADQREIIELSRFQGLKYGEIAEITGNSVSAIKVKVHRSIKKLRQIYFQEA